MRGGLVYCYYLPEVHARDCLTPNEVSTMCVCDREGIAPRAITSAEVALEIRLPELVRRNDFSERLVVRRDSTLLLFGVR